MKLRNVFLPLIFIGATLAQSPTNTVLHPRQVPPIIAPVAATIPAPLNLEIPTAGTVANTWTLTKPVTNFVLCFWNGVQLTVGLDYVFTGNGTGGTLLTLTPGGIAANTWTAPGSTSACLYQ
jgi:hypothetical protein